MTVVSGVNVVTHKKVVDLGKVEISREESTPFYWTPWGGVLLIAVGGGILMMNRRKVIT
jgi:hypothetical protein